MRSNLNSKILLVIMAVFALSAKADNNELFLNGNDLYEKKEYTQAIETYEKVIANGMESSALYFNLGNAYFKSGDLGQAILQYSRAKRLNPADDDIINNLEFARKFTTVPMEGVALNPINGFLEQIVGGYTLNQLAWLASVLFIVMIAMFILRFGFGYNNASIRIVTTLAVIIVVAVSGLTTFKYRTDFLTERAVIIAESSSVYTGPSTNADIELEGAPGLIVEIIDESGEYYNILFENKRRGWIEKSLVEVI